MAVLRDYMSRRKADVTDSSLFVQNDMNVLVDWDSTRIAEVLTTETNVGEKVAKEIADEVSSIIKASGLTTVTSSLVREIVDAKLIERGFESEVLKHQLIGFSPTEVGNIITQKNNENSNVPRGPEATNLVIAEAVKKRYYLNSVLDKDVAEAHMRGDIHIHDLGMPDRNYCGGNPIQYVGKYGLDLPTSISSAKPAKNAEVLLEQVVKFSASLQGCFAGAVGWDAVNMAIAPYIVGKSYAEIKQLAQILVFEFAQQAISRGGQAVFSDLNLYWEIPDHYADVEAIGPGGKGTGKPYKDYLKESQAFVMALFDVYYEGDSKGRPFFFPKANVHITAKMFETEGHEEFLDKICSVASEKGNTYFIIDRGKTARISQCCFDGNQEVILMDIVSDYLGWKGRIVRLKDVEGDNLNVFHMGFGLKCRKVETPRNGRRMFEVILEGEGPMIVTEDHIFPTSVGEKEAQYLQKGDMLYKYEFVRITIDGGNKDLQFVPIESVREIKDYNEEMVYCLEVLNDARPPRFKEDFPDHYFTLPNGIITHNCRLTFDLSNDDLEEAKEPWRVRHSAIQNVTINMPRCAIEAEGDYDKFCANLDKSMRLAMKAHVTKKKYLRALLDMGEDGPLAVLTMNHDGEPYFRLDRGKALLGVVGLSETIRVLTGEEFGDTPASAKYGLKILSYMNQKCKEYSKEFGIHTILEQTPAETTAYRFAKMDRAKYPQYECLFKGDHESGGVYYTNSSYVPVDSDISPIERIKLEGKTHPLITAGSITHIWVGENKPSPEGIKALVKKVYEHTTCSQFDITPEFTTCLDCDRTTRGLVKKCPHCGSEHVEGITRVTGYMSKIKQWNKGKIAELKDRVRHVVA